MKSMKLLNVQLQGRICVRHCVRAENLIVLMQKLIAKRNLHVLSFLLGVTIIDLFDVRGHFIGNLGSRLVPASLAL
jgi:hypothetical protein